MVTLSMGAMLTTAVGFVIVVLIGIVAFFLKGAFAEVKAAIKEMSEVKFAVHDVGTEVRGMVQRLNAHTTTIQAHEGRLSHVENDLSRLWVAMGEMKGRPSEPTNGAG